MILRSARMLAFHATLFAKNSYFAQLLLTSTLSVLLLQYVASFGSGTAVSDQAWMRAGMAGTWTTCAVSTGLVGFQRFQGTLVHQVTSRIGARAALLPVVGSAGTFGILAFPLAGLVAVGLGMPLGAINWSTLLAIAVFWLSSVAVSLLIAASFAHSPDALVYESLVAAPIVLVSGIFGYPDSLASVAPLLRVIPLSSGVHALQNASYTPTFWMDCSIAVIASILWILCARHVADAALRRAIRHATLNIT